MNDNTAQETSAQRGCRLVGTSGGFGGLKVGDEVKYGNHVVGYEIATLEIQSIEDGFIYARRPAHFQDGKPLRFRTDGISTWSPNLSIRLPN